MRPTITLFSLAVLALRVTAVALRSVPGSSTETYLTPRGDPPQSVDNSQLNTCLNPQYTNKGQRVQGCPAKNKLDGNGDCGPLTPDNGCAAFCQVDVRWDYGPEIPFEGATCGCSETPCAIVSTQSTAVQNSRSFNVGISLKKRTSEEREIKGLSPSDLVNVFNAGATWSYSTTYTNATAHTNTKPAIASNKCGYWTFIPYYITTCGSLTYADQVPQVDYASQPNRDYFICGRTMKTTGDWCQQTPYIGSHGGPVGVTVFVAVNCDVGWPLGFCWQDPAYLNAGVSHNESVYNDYLDVHQDFDMNKPVEWTPTVWCEEEEQGYSQGGIPPGCTAGLPSGISLAVYTPPPTA